MLAFNDLHIALFKIKLIRSLSLTEIHCDLRANQYFLADREEPVSVKGFNSYELAEYWNRLNFG
jgi:hypothetical protein